MPVCKIPKNYRNVTGVASDNKAMGKAVLESTLERDFHTLLEFYPTIKSFEAQSIRFNGPMNQGKSANTHLMYWLIFTALTLKRLCMK